METQHPSGLLDPGIQSDVARVYDLIDPPLWLVTAAHGPERGGFIATFAVRASIVGSLPRMILGVAKQHHTWGLIEASGRFALHLLYSDQMDLVWRFGGQTGRNTDKLRGLPTRESPGGSRLITNTLAWLDCRVEARMDTGDRTIYLAAVEGGGTNGHAHPLTAGQLFANAPEERRRQLDTLYARDEAIDAEAILRWRAEQAR
jgi:flavin reductase (DIM6/NTAB) family NADH-FMN oxidoreductase RutF